MPPRARRCGLVELSLRTLQGGKVTGRFLRKLLSTWLHALLFRRPVLALLQLSFRLLPDIAQDDVVYSLPHASAVELMYRCVLAPLLCTDLAAGWAPRLVATDASPYGEGGRFPSGSSGLLT